MARKSPIAWALTHNNCTITFDITSQYKPISIHASFSVWIAVGQEMSSRDALRRLSRKIPTPPEVDQILESLRGEKDMSVAIVASALMDAALERLLIKRFKSKNKELEGRLFQNNGPLSSLNGKILVAHAFGIITSPLAEEMHSIRAIRNTFAHGKLPVSFSSEEVAREVAVLRLARAPKVALDGVDRIIAIETKNAFLLAIRIILILLDEFEKKTGSADEILSGALAEDAKLRPNPA